MEILCKRTNIIFFFVIALFLVLASPANAAINEEISYQGKLTDDTGVAVADGDFDIVFKLYTGPACSYGTCGEWTGTHTTGNGSAVSVQDGIFEVMLGSGTGNSLSAVDFNQTLYLGVTVEADAEMAPRKEIGAVPQAFLAKALQTASGSGAQAGTGADNVLLLDGSGNISISGSTSTSTLTVTSGYMDFSGLASAPATSGGRVYYNSTDGGFYYYDGVGAAWVNLAAGADVTANETVSGSWTFTGEPVLSGAGRHTRKVTLVPEYAGGLLTDHAWTGSASGSNSGNMTTDSYTDGSYNSHNYYEWDSGETTLQDYYIKTIWQLPEDFSAWATSNAITIDYRTETATATDNDVEAYLYLSGNQYIDTASNPSDTGNTSTTWLTGSSGIVFDDNVLDNADTAGERVVIYIKLESKDNNFAQVGDINLTYLSKW